MITRTFVALAGATLIALIVLVGGYWLIEALKVVGIWPPLAAFVAAFIALWGVDALSDYLEARRGPR